MFPFLNKRLSLDEARRSLLESGRLRPEETEWLKNLETRVHKNERGYLDNGEHYLGVGLSALSCIEEAIGNSRMNSPATILDFPSGYGRVLRFLKTAYPHAEIRCMDLDPKAVRFCSRSFKVDAKRSRRDFSSLHMDAEFELIWCGSLISHLDRKQALNLMKCFFRHLRPGGLCILTSHGQRVRELLQSGGINYGLDEEAVGSLLAQFNDSGYSYCDYTPSRNGYGVSLSSDRAIRQIADEAGTWNCSYHAPAGWDNHQDVYSFTKGK